MDALRSLPKVDALSRARELQMFPEKVRTEAARRAVEAMRGRIREGGALNGETPEALAVREAERLTGSSLRNAINLSGVILHTGLGRARLAPSVADHVANVAAGHAMVELDDSGRRGDRQTHVRDLLCALTAAEEALVVNNAAAAVVLSLAALAGGREVILSRGQMVEIGGGFRMPDIVVQSGCRLVEVGCTNKTRLADYESRIGEETGALLRCHRSNFQIVGFTEEPTLGELAELAHLQGIPIIDDMGTGCLIDTSQFGLPKLPTVQDSVMQGADLVIASGDKLLGGSQAGLIVGKRDLVTRLKRHPLARAFRIDKLCLAALEATLRLYRSGREAEIPTVRYLSRQPSEVKALAERLAAAVPGSVVEAASTQVGGGSAPGTELPTWRVGLPGQAEAVAQTLRRGRPAIVTRIEMGKVWLDPRTLDEEEVDIVCERLAEP